MTNIGLFIWIQRIYMIKFNFYIWFQVGIGLSFDSVCPLIWFVGFRWICHICFNLSDWVQRQIRDCWVWFVAESNCLNHYLPKLNPNAESDSILGPLVAKHRQLISRNSMYNGLNAPNPKVSSSKSLESIFPTWYIN